MVEVPLSQGYVALIDDDDAERVLAFKWWVTGGKSRKGKRYAYGIVVDGDGARHQEMLHRFIMNAPKGLDVDHKDNNGLNCQKFNMRLATRAQNNQNKTRSARATLGFKGVARTYGHFRTKPYRAQIKHNYKLHLLGHYETPEEAARAYDKRAREVFGEFACVNFPEDPNERTART